MAGLSKDPYKGVRDFYPKDKALQNYIFDKWRKVAESFGYEEMDASPLEPTELFEAKTGEEIINEQTYTFTDRGERRVTLRPEMTPTVARMVAAKKRELNFPVRWYSIANFFRYERPQKGRLREFYQLNCDLFGASGPNADTEIIYLAYSLMKEIGAKDSQFEIRINSRNFINFLFKDVLNLDDKLALKLSKLVDKKDKLPPAEFNEQVKIILGDKTEKFINVMDVKNFEDLVTVDSSFGQDKGFIEMAGLFQKLDELGIKNYKYEPTLVRGFDYYTGIVFEVYDTGGENTRSIFGGGRYDNLLEIFGEEPIPTVGFAPGDIAIQNFMETYGLLPAYRSTTDLFICTLGEEFISKAGEVVEELRKAGLNVALNLSNKKIGEQISTANKKGIPFVVCIGEEEIKSGKYKVKNLKSGEEKELGVNEIPNFVK